MAYRLVLTAPARLEFDDFFDWLANYSPKTAAEYELDLRRAIRIQILERPYTWPYFFLTGRPYRGYLYAVSKRTSYWLIYTINEDNKTVEMVRFWNSARDPERFDV